MAEGAKVRVVRCPKCENLLPELPDFPLYRCGGCDATLQVKKHLLGTKSVSSEKSDEERGGDCENSTKSPDKRGIVLKETSETDRESESIEFRKRDRVLPGKKLNSSSSSSSRTENRNISNDSNVGREFEPNSSLYGGKYRRSSKAPVENWVVSNNLDSSSDELMRKNTEKDARMNAHIENFSGTCQFRQTANWEAAERCETSAFRKIPRAIVEGVQFARYPDEGTSNNLDSAYGNGKQIKDQDPDTSVRVEYLEQDRAELLRKIDELRDQLSRSCDVSENTKERVSVNRRLVPPNSYDGHDTWLPESSSAPIRASSKLYPPDNRFRRPSYLNNEPVPVMNRYDMDMRNGYPPNNAQNKNLGYMEPFGSQMLKKAPHPYRRYPQRPSGDHLSGNYMEIDPDPLVSYPHNAFYDLPPCSCLNCHNKHWQVPAQVPPSVICNQHLPHAGTNHMFYNHDGPGTFGPVAYNHRAGNAPMRSREPPPLARKPCDLDSDMGGFRRSLPQRAMRVKGNGRTCQPISGGAPFITCYNCFELLQLPSNILSIKENRHKLRCGACSKVITFIIEGKRLIVSVPTKPKHLQSEVSNDSGDVKNEELFSHGNMDERIINTYSKDHDDSNYNIQSTGTEPVSSAPFPIAGHCVIGKENMPNISASEKNQGLSLSFSSPENEECPESMVIQRNMSNSMELPLNSDVIPPVQGSPCHEHYGDSPTNLVASKFGNGNRSKHSDQEKMVSKSGTSRQNSVKDASVATEVEVSYNDYANSAMSQDSGEVSKEENRSRFSKRGDSFFAGLIKKSFRDLGRSNQPLEDAKTNVSINGQPIPDRLVKKAEKLAGPILPGQYWYDCRAGFWGVMGQQCIGIIPPSIEEFNYPMPKNCAGGNTGIFVNGRELHPKDFELLASRGLPTSSDMSYIIDISGRVVDEATGEELVSLGKLAPTVVKVKHGFGMRVPRAVT
ncbi:uncharacterized protein LOC143860583 [Tasmannia lanceolata]|uniref:uncharacterized protein LOC143860583 n=1 Tax=Tasmannia lanceolata TaxID=3420 RepID=UPI0040628E32